MVETIAIITEKGVPGKDIKENSLVNIFRLEDNKVFSYESLQLKSYDNESFFKMLRFKEISLIYIDSVNNELRRLLNKLNIRIKCKEDWSDDEFIKQFVFS